MITSRFSRFLAVVVAAGASSAAYAGYGNFLVISSANVYCDSSICTPAVGYASDPVLNDGKVVSSLFAYSTGLQISISGFSSDPGAGYLSYVQIDGCPTPPYTRNFYPEAANSYFYSGGTAYWDLPGDWPSGGWQPCLWDTFNYVTIW